MDFDGVILSFEHRKRHKEKLPSYHIWARPSIYCFFAKENFAQLQEPNIMYFIPYLNFSIYFFVCQKIETVGTVKKFFVYMISKIRIQNFGIHFPYS